MFLYGKQMNEVLQLSIKESFMRGLFFAMVTSNQYLNNYHGVKPINLHYSTILNLGWINCLLDRIFRKLHNYISVIQRWIVGQ